MSVVICALVLVVAGFALVGEIKSQLAVTQESAEAQALAGIENFTNAPAGFKKGIAYGSRSVHFTAEGDLLAGVNQVAWRNTTGRKVVVDKAEMRTTGTASSSYLFYVGTSTAASNTSFDFGTAMFSELIDAPSLATSSPIKVFTSMSDTDQGTNGRGAIEVEDGEYVLFMFRKQDLINSCSGSVCEAATSTNRGFNVRWLLEGHYIP